MMAACLVVGDSYIVWHISDLIRWFQDRGMFQASGEAGIVPSYWKRWYASTRHITFMFIANALNFLEEKEKMKCHNCRAVSQIKLLCYSYAGIRSLSFTACGASRADSRISGQPAVHPNEEAGRNPMRSTVNFREGPKDRLHSPVNRNPWLGHPLFESSIRLPLATHANLMPASACLSFSRRLNSTHENG